MMAREIDVRISTPMVDVEHIRNYSSIGCIEANVAFNTAKDSVTRKNDAKYWEHLRLIFYAIEKASKAGEYEIESNKFFDVMVTEFLRSKGYEVTFTEDKALISWHNAG